MTFTSTVKLLIMAYYLINYLAEGIISYNEKEITNLRQTKDNYRLLELSANFFFGISFYLKLIWLIYDPILTRFNFFLPEYIRLSGLVILGLSGVIWIWSRKALGNRCIGDIALDADRPALITTGPYRWIRHPVYLSFILDSLGFTLVTSNWLIIISTWLSTLFYLAKCGPEEKLLLKNFKEFPLWKKRTGKFLPRSFRGYI